MLDPRMSDVIRPLSGAPAPNSFVLIGFPQDEGVRRNGGRTGAAAGPGEIRARLGRFVIQPEQAICDAGDIACTADLEASQARLGEAVAEVLRAGAIPIVLGGGHEAAYGHFLGYQTAGRRCGILNLDAHLDVRPLKGDHGHSGSPFRQALEHPDSVCLPGGYLCVGMQPQANAAFATAYVQSRGADWIDLQTVRETGLSRCINDFHKRLSEQRAALMLTVDLDAIRQADAPGVSAPSPIGFTAEEALELVRLAAARGAASLDVVELNPSLDRDGQTARLAALIVDSFIRAWRPCAD